MTDEAEGEELGLTGWHSFDDYSVSHFGQRERFQYQMLKGDTTGLKELINFKCFFIDSTGYLNLNFDSPDQVRYYITRGGSRLPPGVLDQVNNLMSCGPMNWASGDTLHFVFGILVAENLNELKGKLTEFTKQFE